MKQNKHALREQGESWENTVAGCWWYGQSYDDVSSWWTREGRQKRPDGAQAKMRAETKPEKTRVDHNKVVGFRWICIYLVFRGDPVWYRTICRDISWYHIPYHSVSQDTIYRDIRPTSRFFGTDIEISYPVEIFLDIERIFCPARCTKFSALSYGRDIRKGTQGLSTLAWRTASLLYRRLLTVVLNLRCEREWRGGWWMSVWGDDSRS